MSRHKKNVISRMVGEVQNQVILEAVPPTVLPTVIEKIYAFPSKCLCPRCGTVENHATSTQRQIQYRQCQRPICRHRWSVLGQRIDKK